MTKDEKNILQDLLDCGMVKDSEFDLREGKILNTLAKLGLVTNCWELTQKGRDLMKKQEGTK